MKSPSVNLTAFFPHDTPLSVDNELILPALVSNPPKRLLVLLPPPRAMLDILTASLCFARDAAEVEVEVEHDEEDAPDPG